MVRSLRNVCEEVQKKVVDRGFSAKVIFDKFSKSIKVNFRKPDLNQKQLVRDSTEVDRVIERFCEKVRDEMKEVREIMKEYDLIQTNYKPHMLLNMMKQKIKNRIIL